MAKRKIRRKKQNKNDNLFKILNRLLLFSIFAFAVILTIKKYLIETSSFNSTKYFVKGIDVSHHNPILNWNNAEREGISFAYLKSTEGTSHEDRNYIYNYDLASKTNIKIGSYHFYTFGASGTEQAKHFIKNSKFKQGDLIPAIDVEHSSINIYSKDSAYVKSVIKELKVLENQLYEYFGVHPIIYSNKDCYSLYIKKYFPNNLIWISALHNEPTDDITNWRIWQFSHQGKLSDLDEHIDFNYYRYSYQDFKELLLP